MHINCKSNGAKNMLNKVTLIGRLGANPESKTMNSGAEIVNFSIATSESYTDKKTIKK
ncbi:hypothetical protein GCM10023261_11150 [Bartonella jaculi]|uniref:Single-stranded DNA-binding protein n=1 Tax=Bartonella jaculi TaxID=686226 RepID=A0ABP9N5F4_9HYPH